MTARIGVITFPGSLDDRDAQRAIRLAGGEPVALWHGDHDLQGVDALVLPGGFSYGDYLRAGAIAAFAPDLGPGLLGDKAHSVVFDVSKVTALVPEFRTSITFDEGARRILAHHDAHPADQRIDGYRDDAFDRIAAYARSAG